VSPSDAVEKAADELAQAVDLHRTSIVPSRTASMVITRRDALIAAVEARTLARVRGIVEALDTDHDEMEMSKGMYEAKRTILRSLSASEDTTQGET
jgi:hypothetical protein